MKYVKSLLALAFAALLGTAAQASMIVANDLGDTHVTIRQKTGGDGTKDYIADVTMKVGEKVVLQLKSDKSNKGYTPTVVGDQPTLWTATLSAAEIPNGGSVNLTIEALKATTSTQTLLYYKDADAVKETDATPVEINITITNGDVIRESFSIENGSATNLTLSGSAATDSWTAEVTTGGECVDVNPKTGSGDAYSLTISTLAVTETPATVTVQKNGEDFAIYTVTVTKGADFVMFGGQKIFYSNATTNMVSGELLLTFTNTAAAGTFKLPADFDARVLIVGGGAGGLGSYGKNNPDNGYGSNGGNGGSVVEKTLDDAFVLSSGDYTVTVGKGGNSVAGTTSSSGSAGGYWNVNNPGAKSSLVGGEDSLEAAGGTAFSGLAQTTKINNKLDDGVSTQQDDQGAVCVANKTSLYYSHDGKGAGAGESEKWVKTGATSDISGAEVAYGVGGAGGATGDGTDYVKIEGAAGAPAHTGNGGAGGSNGGAGGKGADGIVIVRLLPSSIETPTVCVPIVGTLTYGQAVAETQWAGSLTNSAGETVSGTFAWKDPESLELTVTSGRTYSVDFTPDSSAYAKVTVDGTLVVNAAPKVPAPVEDDEGNAVTVKVSKAWLDKNKFSENDLTPAQLAEKLNEKCAGDNFRMWEKFALGLNTNEAFVADAPQGGNADAVSIMAAVNPPPETESGVVVKFRLDKDEEEVEETDSKSISVPVNGADPSSANYELWTGIIQNENETWHKAANKIGILRKDAFKSSGGARELISVPWSAANGGDILVSNLVQTAGLTVGDKLYAYVAANAAYNCWVLNASKCWEPAAKQFKISGGKIEEGDAQDPTVMTIARGTAVWLDRQDASKPVVFVGQANATPVALDPAVGMNLMSVDGIGTLDVTTLGGNAGDRVIVPTAEGEPKEYKYDTEWYYMERQVDTKTGITRKVRNTTGLTVGRGAGFWWDRNESK